MKNLITKAGKLLSVLFVAGALISCSDDDSFDYNNPNLEVNIEQVIQLSDNSFELTYAVANKPENQAVSLTYVYFAAVGGSQRVDLADFGHIYYDVKGHTLDLSKFTNPTLVIPADQDTYTVTLEINEDYAEDFRNYNLHSFADSGSERDFILLHLENMSQKE